MDSACPICNKLEDLNMKCPSCQQAMEERGRLSEFWGPYSADMPIESSLSCEHVFYCSKCNKLENISISSKLI